MDSSALAGCVEVVGIGYLRMGTDDRWWPKLALCSVCCGNPGPAVWIRMPDQGPGSAGEVVSIASERLVLGLCSVKVGVGAVVFWRGH